VGAAVAVAVWALLQKLLMLLQQCACCWLYTCCHLLDTFSRNRDTVTTLLIK
jgi:hypothetical protein